MKKALELDPEYADAHLYHAEACEVAGRLREAVAAYRKFLALAPVREKAKIEKANTRLKALQGP